MAFLVKKIVSHLFYPLPICLFLFILGLVFLFYSRRQKTGRVIILAGTVLLILLSFSIISDHFVKYLEYTYPPFLVNERENETPRNDISSVKWVVVLGGGVISDQKVPITSRISPVSMVRLIEGIRIYHEIPGSKLILSSGRVFDTVPEAIQMEEIAKALGVKKEDILIEPDSLDTCDEARLIKTMVKDDVFVLVTSAMHMPRSMALFKKQGMHPIPAPTDYTVLKRQCTNPGRFFPSSAALVQSKKALHEYIGIIWSKLRGQIE